MKIKKINIDKIKLNKSFDRRCKLTEQDKEDIKALYSQGAGIREIARQYEDVCSRRMIQFIVFPERQAHLQAIKTLKKSHLLYYNKEKHTQSIKDLRDFKKDILLMYFYILNIIN
jgi:hypothetical protein